MLLNDFNNYLKDNKNFINELKKNANHCYNRIDDALRVMNFISAMEATQNKIDEDLTIISEVGVAYIQDTIETCKAYYTNYFNSDIKEFSKYDDCLSYLLYFEDITETLKEKKLYNEEKLKPISEKLENILLKKLQFTDDDMDACDMVIIDCAADRNDVYTTYEVFTMIAEELDV